MTYTTWSYWRYALFSWSPVKRLLAVVGAAYLMLEVFDFFSVLKREDHSKWTLAGILVGAVIVVLYTVRPVRSIAYKPPNRDLCFRVRIADILNCEGEVVISTNTTFDTDMASGLIATNSLQGQFAQKFFGGRTDELDRLITGSLRGVQELPDKAVSPGKSKRYPVGTVAKVSTHGRNFYLLAMAELNEQGNAQSSVALIDDALKGLWNFMASKGELGELVVPLLGMGRGRVSLPRKRIIERIAQSFAYASGDRRFAHTLTIVIHRSDAERYNLNLFEIRDYLAWSLDV